MEDCELIEGLREEVKELNLQLNVANTSKGFYEGRSAALTAQVEAQIKQINELIGIIKEKKSEHLIR